MLSRRRAHRALLGIVILGGLMAGPSLAAVAADDVPDEGITIDVEVLGPSATPSPSSSPTRSTTGSGSPSVSQPATAPETGEELGDDAIDLGGVLYVGGLRGSIAPSVGARGGDAMLSITVRNSSDELTDLDLRFWVQNGVGATIGEVSNVRVSDLRPDETRTIRTSVTTVGQWTFYTAHVKVTPPKELDGVALSPITRDSTLLVPPYFVLLTGSAAALLYVLIRFVLVRRLLGIGVPA